MAVVRLFKKIMNYWLHHHHHQVKTNVTTYLNKLIYYKINNKMMNQSMNVAKTRIVMMYENVVN
jgi:hypothetical protein